jgi:hypothetical protein
VSDGKESFKKSKKKQDEDMKMQETSSTKAWAKYDAASGFKAGHWTQQGVVTGWECYLGPPGMGGLVFGRNM